MKTPSTFSLKSLLLLIVFAALAISLILTRIDLTDKSAQLESYRNEMRYLNISDESKINVISIPGVGERSWRWRVFVPEQQTFRLNFAFKNIPINGLRESPPDLTMGELPPGESILSASLNMVNGKWGLNMYSETEGNTNFDFVADIDGSNVEWLQKRGGNSVRRAGRSGTQDGPADTPFLLLSCRAGLTPSPGVTATNPKPTDGVLIWIEKTK